MYTLKNANIINDEIERLKDYDREALSSEQWEAASRYYKVQIEDLREIDQVGAGAVPDIAAMIDEV